MTEEIEKNEAAGAPEGLDRAEETAVPADEVIAPAPEPFALKPAPGPVEAEPKKKAGAKDAPPDEASQSPFSVTVGQVYDGPLDLLLDLIRKQNIDIYDIPIALLTAQFLD